MLRQVLSVRVTVPQLKRFCATAATNVKFNPNDDYYSQAYADEFSRSLTSPEDYWAENGEKYVKWMKKWDRVLDNSSAPFTKWYKGGLLNVCYNALDRHVEDGHGDHVALIHDTPITKSPIKNVTYAQLLEMVEKLAGVYDNLGVRKGDRVLIYMPMIPEAVAAMLASARLGAVHSLVFGGFAPRELAVRINHAQPTLIVTTNAGFEPNRTVEYKKFVDQALGMSGAPVKHVLVFDRPEADKANFMAPRDVPWGEAMDKAIPHHCVPVEADHPLYILYTSGTTGDPKGIQRPSGGHAVALPWSMDKVFNVQPGETWWAASDLGWVVGHSYICYGPLLRRLTSVLYEGKPVGTPDAGQFFRMRSLFVVGEHCDYETREWAQDKFRVPVLDHWWQTETGHAITATCLGFGQSANPPRDVSGMALPGYDVRILKEDNQEAARGELGRIVIKLPLPPGCMSTLYKADDRFRSAYFNEYRGYYDTMDAGFIDQHGFVCVMARDDDVINVAGHRLSTSALEEAILEHPDVVDCAVVGVPDELKGEVPLGLFVMSKGCTKDAKLVTKEIIEIVRELVGPVAAFKLAVPVEALPRTRSGKTARKSIADFARDKQIKLPGTIEDPEVYKDIKRALNTLGFAKNAPKPHRILKSCNNERRS